jgi:hypothetical protein
MWRKIEDFKIIVQQNIRILAGAKTVFAKKIISRRINPTDCEDNAPTVRKMHIL